MWRSVHSEGLGGRIAVAGGFRWWASTARGMFLARESTPVARPVAFRGRDQAARGREMTSRCAFLKLPDGKKIIRVGKPGQVLPTGATENYAHSHDNGFLMLSDVAMRGQFADTIALARRSQTVTYLVGPAGDLLKVSSASGRWIDDVIHEIVYRAD